MDRIRLGMVGGGTDAFIGAVHRIASRIDDRFELVAGALSSTPEKARTSGAALGLAEDRSYGTFEEMAEREAGRDDGIEAVSIVTPNHVHAAAARAVLHHHRRAKALLEEGGEQAGVGVIAAAGAVADHQLDDLAFVKLGRRFRRRRAGGQSEQRDGQGERRDGLGEALQHHDRVPLRI